LNREVVFDVFVIIVEYEPSQAFVFFCVIKCFKENDAISSPDLHWR
jgi:hypothetical protein